MPKVHMDEFSQRHVSQRIMERIRDPLHRRQLIDFIKRLTTLDAPLVAIGEYMWHVDVPGIGRVVMRGHSVRTVYSFDENYPGGTAYKIVGNMLVRA